MRVAKPSGLVEVKTAKEPDWGVIGTAIGRKVIEDVPYITGLDQYFESGKVTPDNLHLLKAMGSATASSGAVGLYHVEGVTPDAKKLGRNLLVEGYQTYVIDDAEQQRMIDSFPNLWPEKDGDPTAAFIGCPHNTYHEVIKWGRLLTEALDKAGQTEAAIPVYMFMPNKVRDRAIEEQGNLISRMKRAGIHATNMCSVSYAGMKGFSERVRGVTNSAKTRNYSSVRYFPDQILVRIIVTGKIPDNHLCPLTSLNADHHKKFLRRSKMAKKTFQGRARAFWQPPGQSTRFQAAAKLDGLFFKNYVRR